MSRNGIETASVCCGEDARLVCAECCEHLPSSGVMQSEADDYVYYFCGPDCYQAWRNTRGQAEEMNP